METNLIINMATIMSTADPRIQMYDRSSEYVPYLTIGIVGRGVVGG